MTEQRLVAVSGASTGLGYYVVKEFASAGWLTFGLGRSEKPSGYPLSAQYYQGDAAEYKHAESFWSQVAEASPLDTSPMCLINCAGAYTTGSILESTVADIEASIRSNYLAPAALTRSMLGKFQRARIINVISSSALRASSNNALYGSAKAGVAQLFRSIQEEFPPSRICITNLYPETIRTHGEGPDVLAIEPEELVRWIRSLAEDGRSFYLSDVTILPC